MVKGAYKLEVAGYLWIDIPLFSYTGKRRDLFHRAGPIAPITIRAWREKGRAIFYA